MAPNARTAFGLVTHKKRAVLFGGIVDQEGKVGLGGEGRGRACSWPGWQWGAWGCLG